MAIKNKNPHSRSGGNKNPHSRSGGKNLRIYQMKAMDMNVGFMPSDLEKELKNEVL